jgi:hypothetical protein
MRARYVSTTASLFLVAVSVAACSSGSTSTAGQTQAGTSPSPARTTVSATNDGGGTVAPAGVTKNVDLCSVLPASAVSQITGTTFTKAKASATAGVFECEYHGPNYVLLQISVTTQAGGLGYDQTVSSLKTVGYPPNSVPGVGDKAFSEPDPNGNAGSAGASAFASFGALYGDTYVQIGGLTYVTADQGTQIAEQLHNKL